jgi:acetyl-CoA decarbonylase/synthase complex subunit delta
MGCGKVFLTSKKFLYAEGGFKRLVWMPKELKTLLKDDLEKRFAEQGIEGLMDKIADETVAVDAQDVRAFLEKTGHPSLKMEDMAACVASGPTNIPDEKTEDTSSPVVAKSAADVQTQFASKPEAKPGALASGDLESIKAEIKNQLITELKESITREVVNEIIRNLSQKFLGTEYAPKIQDRIAAKPLEKSLASSENIKKIKDDAPKASEKIEQIKAFTITKERCEIPVWTVKLGATKEEGGTRAVSYSIGGASCMPFHLWEGKMPNRPLVALEIFDSLSSKYPESLRAVYGELLSNPVEMAKICVNKYGADLISVRLEGTHPEKGNRSAAESVSLVRNVLKAVNVPLIVTGHNHFEKNNEVMKAVAQACQGENLLLNYVEQNNYRTIAGAAIAYGHTIVAQSPIDVNIAKQLNILLSNMDMKQEKIVMDPITGATGYGIEYTYSVMERIRITGLNGDKMLAGPMIVSPGQECSKIKELKAAEASFPAWGDLAQRAAIWELTTATSLLYAGADLLIMYHPEAAVAIKKTISKLAGE